MNSGFLINLFEKAQMPLGLDGEREEKFYIYLKELQKWNEKINLTAIKSESEIVEKLFLDSVYFLKFLPIRPGSVCLDIGSGAGFPGLPIKILCPETDLTLLEATKKKGAFLKHLIRILSLSKCQVIIKRFEEICNDESFKRKFDFITIRAVSLSQKLILHAYNLLKDEGAFLYFGGEKGGIESFLAKSPFAKIEAKEYKLPVSKLSRTLLTFRK